jgi:hypothetical protein
LRVRVRAAEAQVRWALGEGLNMHLLLWALLAFGSSQADFLSDSQVPAEVLPFIDAGNKAIAIEKADLNGDGLQDYLVVFQEASTDPDDLESSDRPFVILTRSKSGQLVLAARNDKAVLCGGCGGVRGDPFVRIDVSTDKFTVHNAGGSSTIWMDDDTFQYSPRSRQWFLSRVVVTMMHGSNPENEQQRVFTPKDYGKIELSHFDPKAWSTLFWSDAPN